MIFSFKHIMPTHEVVEEKTFVATLGETIPLTMPDGEIVPAVIKNVTVLDGGRSLEITVEVPDTPATERLRPPSRPGDYSLERS